ncbi:MAG: hypothetical protein V1702_00975 [Candidatus Woesearchaeota archaeon]
MQIKIRKVTPDGEVRLEAKVDIKEVMINESFMPAGETVMLGFRGKSSSGLIELKRSEAEKLCRSLKGRLHLIKGAKILEE